MIDSDSWSQFVLSFFASTGIDKEWLDHIILNWNALKSESACGCHIEDGVIQWCKGYEDIVDNRRANVDDRYFPHESDDDEPLGEKSEIY